MSTTASSHDSLIEKLQRHLKVSGYCPGIQRRYVFLAGKFLEFCDREHLCTDAVSTANVTQFVQERYRLRQRRHKYSPSIHTWQSQHTAAIHVLLRLIHGKWPIPASPATELEAYHRDIVDDYDTWLRDLRGLSQITRSRRTKFARDFLAWHGPQADRTGLANLSVRDVDAYLRQCCNGLRRRSIESHTVCLRDFLRHLHRSGQAATDLAGTVIGPRIYDHEDIPSALRADEVQRVLAVARENRSPAGLRDYAILILLATYGLRAGEIVSLRLEDVDWRRDVLHVYHSKTGTSSQLPLLREPGEAVLRYLEKARPPSTYREVFLRIPAPHRPFRSGSALYSVTNARLQAAGITPQGRKGPHSFRHARAERLLHSGIPLNVIGDVLGHRSSAAVGIYLKLATHDLRDVGLELPGRVSL